MKDQSKPIKDSDLWKIHLSKSRHNRLCAECHFIIGIDGGECMFETDHDNDGQYTFICDSCKLKREEI